MIYILFLVGFVLLIKGAGWLVSGATAMAARLGVSDLIVGLTIVSMGTSMPELLVNVLASASGSSGLATGNILGSNIANVLLILGLTAAISDLPVQRNTVLSEVPFSLAAALLIGFLANSALWYETADELEISRGDGIIILFFFFLFMVYVFTIAKEELRTNPGENLEVPSDPASRQWLSTLAGMGGQYKREGEIKGAHIRVKRRYSLATVRLLTQASSKRDSERWEAIMSKIFHGCLF